MNLRRIFLLYICICFINLCYLFSPVFAYLLPSNFESFITKKPQTELTIRCKLTYSISLPGDTRWIRLIALTPESVPNIQEINRVNYSRDPIRYFRSNGYRYAEFLIYNPEKTEKLEVTIDADLYKYDLQTAINNEERKKLLGHDVSDIAQDVNTAGKEELDLDKYLIAEKYIEKDSNEIQEIAKNISGESEIEIVRNIYEYVLDHMEYLIQGKRDHGALNAFKTCKGDCSEYSDLFVAICRAKKIPARFITGISVQSDTKTAKHNWAEVYLKEYGWVPFDPSKGDVRYSNIRERLFGSLEPAYLYFSHIRNDNELKGYYYCAYSYSGDPIHVTDSIEFEFPKNEK